MVILKIKMERTDPMVIAQKEEYQRALDEQKEEIIYKRDHSYSANDVKELFLSVDWLSGKYPEKLKKALDNCETVITAWKGDKLVGLINAIDDGELTAYVHYLCVNPKYQGFGIGGELIKQIKEKYRDYLYIIVIAENEGLIEYYKKNGFEHIDERYVLAVQNELLCNIK